MLTVSNVSARFGDQLVLDNISFTINRADRVGIVGPNGAGKTTLLSILAGDRKPDVGSVSLIPGVSTGYLRQGFADLADGTLNDLLDFQLDGLLAAQARLETATAALDDATEPDSLALEALGDASESFEQRGGYALVSEMELHLARFGLEGLPLDTSLDRLSGGEKTRAGLAALLATKPDLLLLDEPTNHLDIDALEWLESFINGYRGAVAIVSHDRGFIDATVNRIVELDGHRHTLSVFPGNYSDYLNAKRRAAESQADAFDRQQREIARIERDVREVAGYALRTERATTNDYVRGRAKKVARTAKVRERKLERLLDSTDTIEEPDRAWGLAVELRSSGESGNDVVIADDLSLSFGDRTLLADVSFVIRAGERVSITGPNGAGKSSLLRLITGEIAPSHGSVRLGSGVRPGFLGQEQEGIKPQCSALDHIRLATPGEEGEARAFLHKFLFTSDNVHRPAAALSYGERARLSLALLVRRGANLLLLDEPLNHLDLSSREQFEDALLGFDGTVIAVLHDRFAIERLTTRVLELRDGRLIEH